MQKINLWNVCKYEASKNFKGAVVTVFGIGGGGFAPQDFCSEAAISSRKEIFRKKFKNERLGCLVSENVQLARLARAARVWPHVEHVCLFPENVKSRFLGVYPFFERFDFNYADPYQNKSCSSIKAWYVCLAKFSRNFFHSGMGEVKVRQK